MTQLQGSEEYKALTNQAYHGERAREISLGKDWEWVKQFILGALHDQAIHTLMNSKSEEDRIKAQQMFLASRKPNDLLEFLISQGDAARASLRELNESENIAISENGAQGDNHA